MVEAKYFLKNQKCLAKNMNKLFWVTLQNVYSQNVYSQNVYSQNVYSQNVYSPSVHILTVNVYDTKTYTNIPGFSLSASSSFLSLQQAPDTDFYQ
jgi:hypothetical protein